MKKKITELAKKFINIQSDPNKPEALNNILTFALSQVNEYTIEHFEKKEVKSALVYNSKSRPEKFKILFNIHLDVIPGKKEQYSSRIEGNKLYGVGAMDMKGNAAAAILAFKHIAKDLSYPVALQLVTDEEIGGFEGTMHQIKKGVRADFIIATEPTNFEIVNQAKGVLWLQIQIKGKTAHGAYPWQGDNALVKANNILNSIRKMIPNPDVQEWVTTVNISNIKTKNNAYNKIPDDALIELDIRFIPEDANTIVEKIKNILPKDCTLTEIANEPAMYTEKQNDYLQLLKKITKKETGIETVRPAQGSSDARHFTRVGCPGIEFGPIGKGIGSDNEWVDILSLEKYYTILKKFLHSIK